MVAAPFPRTRIAITGASSGLGEEFARQLARQGAHLVLTARRADRLAKLADQLRNAYHVDVDVAPYDLGVTSQVQACAKAYRDAAITGLVNAAGFGTFGPLATADPARIDAEVQLNVAALTTLTVQLWPTLLQSAHGLLINVASTASFQPIPNMAVYAASKAYVRSLTEALWDEAVHAGATTRVLCLNPGPTRTEFFDVIETDQFAMSRIMSAEDVVSEALQALERRHPPVDLIPGLGNRMIALGTRFAPQGALARVTGRMMRRGDDPTLS